MSLPFIERVYTGDSLYLTRVRLTPRVRWGQLCLHVFHRGDMDTWPHDHPFDFWTFPLSHYRERVLRRSGQVYDRTVTRWRWHYRPAEFTHRVLGKVDPFMPWEYRHLGRFYTLIWRRPKRRDWGFWADGVFVPWEDYAENWEAYNG